MPLGRPALAPGLAKTVVLSVRFTPAEMKRVEKAAKRAGQKPPDFLRSQALSDPKP